jgi:hypothetical protein
MSASYSNLLILSAMTNTSAVDTPLSGVTQPAVLPGALYTPRAIDPTVSPAGAHLQAMEAARYRYAIDHGFIMLDSSRTVLTHREQADRVIDQLIGALPGAPAIPEPVRSPSTSRPQNVEQPRDIVIEPFRLSLSAKVAIVTATALYALYVGNNYYATKQRAAEAKKYYELSCIRASV